MEAEIVVKFLMRGSPQFFAFGTTREDASSLIRAFALDALQPIIHRESEAGVFAVRVEDIAAIHTEQLPRQAVPGIAGPVGRLAPGTSGVQR